MPERADDSQAGRPRILVCGWAGAGNIGDELLTDWVVDVAEAEGGHVLLTTRSFGDTRVRHPSVTPVGWRLRDLARVLTGVDAICVGPGGIIQDSSSVWSLPGHLSKALVGRLRRLPVAGVGLGAEPLVRRSSGWLLRHALRDPIGVVVRDRGSADALAAVGIETEVDRDLVFGLAPIGSSLPSSERDGVVVAVGPSVVPGRLLPVARRHDHSGVTEVADAVGAWATRLELPVSVAAFRGRPDVAFGQELVDRLGHRARLIPADPAAIREAIAGSRLVLGSRYHASVLGLVEGTPVVVRSEETKLRSLVEEVDDPARIRALGSWADLEHLAPPEPLQAGIGSVRMARNRRVLTALVAAARRE